MTPAERATARAEHLAELEEKLQDLILLRSGISGTGRSLGQLAEDIAEGRDLGDIAERTSGLSELDATVSAYREAHARAKALVQVLTRSGPSPLLENIDIGPAL